MNIYQILDLATATLREYGLDAQGWTAELDNGKRRAGACHYSRRVVSFSQHILPNASDEDILETVRHEVAHALVGHAAGHGPEFKRQLIEMGGTGARTHKMEVPELRWVATCPEHGKIGTRRSTPQGIHTHKRCGKPITWTDSQTGRVIGGVAVPKRTEIPIIDIFVPAHKVAASKPAPKVQPKPAEGPECACECGGRTKGGSYLPGHDARHVKQVFEQWLNNELDYTGAMAIFVTRTALATKLDKRIAAHAATYKN